ncbi:MAG TPA: PRC-barrel domain-containing protein [Chitinophagaceae bacterium]|jgi:sporulation protein YlmC with PRC-barrel domain|nr:PRC-barrel domain-containing protein [Chitinophagaceae bacterium]
MSTKLKRLQELRGSGYEVAKGQPDIRGWEVRNDQGHLIGKVHELIFDSRANKVRYMIINVNDSREMQLEKRTIMVPIGLAVLEQKDDDVILQNVTPFQLRALPRYSKEDLGTRSEHAISTVFGRDTKFSANTTSSSEEEVDESFYNNEMFDETNMYNRRNNKGNSQGYQQDNTQRLSDAERTSLKKDTELHGPKEGHLGNDTHRNETEAEYLRRKDRERNNPGI